MDEDKMLKGLLRANSELEGRRTPPHPDTWQRFALPDLTHAEPFEADQDLPPCPLCKAPARSLTLAAKKEQLETGLWPLHGLAHDCDCEVEDWPSYHQGIVLLRRRERFRAAYLETLPTRYRAMLRAELQVHEGNRGAHAAALELSPGGFLYLWGPQGNGKTMLAVQTVHRLIRAEPGAFWSTAVWLEAIRKSYSDDAPDAPDLSALGTLVLDDIGKEKPSPWVAERVFEVIEARWSNQRTTILTSQYPPDVAASRLYPDDKSAAAALMSRLASGFVRQVRGDDRRLGR